jgi:hypothetical protein
VFEFEVQEDDGVSVDGPSHVTKIATSWEAGRLAITFIGDAPPTKRLL